jgi:hypothetical protein
LTPRTNRNLFLGNPERFLEGKGGEKWGRLGECFEEGDRRATERKKTEPSEKGKVLHLRNGNSRKSKLIGLIRAIILQGGTEHVIGGIFEREISSLVTEKFQDVGDFESEDVGKTDSTVGDSRHVCWEKLKNLVESDVTGVEAELA